MTHHIRFEVTAQVDLPEDADKELVQQLALSCVAQTYEVNTGPPEKIKWTKVYVDVSDSDIIEEWYE